MKKYRSRLDIAAMILKVAQARGGVYKTRIMYDAYLSFPQLKEYLPVLIDNQLLELLPDRKMLYHTTNKGTHFLNTFHEMYGILYPIKEGGKRILTRTVEA